MLKEKLPDLIPARFRSPSPQSSTALYFVVNADFLVPLRVLIYSLLKTGSFLDLPIVIFTDEQAVADDHFVQRIATKIVLVTKEQKDSLNVIKRGKIPPRFRREDLPKYTFIKWMMFDDIGYKSALFLDADIICLQNANSLLDYLGQADLMVGPQFKDVIRYENEEARIRRSRDEAYEMLINMLEGRFDSFHQNLNSGVMLMSERMLKREFRQELISFAQEIGAMPNEQRYLTEKFASGSHQRVLIPSKYNFHEMFLYAVDPLAQFDLLSRICLLHYAGPEKPWNRRIRRASYSVWYQALDEIKDLTAFSITGEWPV
jgi:lipopolysaccharide biosynthesis glycosyltransferase